MAVGDGFHVDSSGNLWLGSTRETFDATTRSEAPFYIYANGSIVANNGTFSGDISGASGTFTGDLSGADITGGTINIGSGTFQVDSSGNMTATSATLSGYLAAGSDFDDLSETGSIVGWVLDSANGRFIGEDGSGNYLYLDSSGNIAGNYSAGSSGWKINANGDAEFNSIDIRVAGASSDTPSTGLTTLDIGSTQVYENNDDLFINTSGTSNFVNIRDRLKLTSTSTSGSNMQLMFDGPGTDDAMGFRHETDFPNTSNADLIWTNQSGSSDYNKIAYVTTTDDYFHLGVDAPGIKTDFTGSPTMYFDGPGSASSDSATFNMAVRPYTIKDKDGDIGSSGQVLSSTGSRIDWIDLPSGNDHPDSDHSFAASSHSHNDLYFTETEVNNLLNGKANSSHGTHVSYGGNGNASSVSRSDHSHSSSGITSVNGATGSSGALTLSTTSGTSTFSSSFSFISSSEVRLNKSTSGYISTGYPTGSKRLGTSSSDRFSNIYSASFYGTFYGQNINASSRNIKENIVDTSLGLDFINDLTVKDFTMIDTDTFGTQKYTGFIAEDIQDYLTDNSLDYKLVEDYSSKYEYNNRCSHVVECTNEETETIHGCEEDCCSEYYTYTNEDGDKQNFLHTTVEECEAYMPDENRHPHLYFNNFIGPLVKAVQELSTKIDDLTARVEALEA